MTTGSYAGKGRPIPPWMDQGAIIVFGAQPVVAMSTKTRGACLLSATPQASKPTVHCHLNSLDAQMTSKITAGRIVGALILTQMVGGVASNFVLSAPLFEPPGFLENAAPNSVRIASSALLAMGLGGITLAIAAIMSPAIWKRSQALAVLFAALSAASMAVGAIEQIHVMSMVSLSQAYTQLPVAEREPFQALRGMVAASRNWSHYVNLIVVGCTLLLMYSALLRQALIPRLLAAIGVIAAALQVLAVATPLFGGRVNFVLLAPLGLTQLVVAIWLLKNGFRNSPQSIDA